MQYLLTFLAMFATDILYTLWVRRAAEGSALSAAGFAATLLLTNGFVTIQFVKNNWHLVAAALGAFLGTWITILIDSAH